MTAAGQLLVRKHQLTQIRNGGLAAALVMQLGEDLLKGKINRDEFIAGVIAQGRLSHGAAVRLAKQFLTEYHQLEAPHLEHLAPPMLAADDGAALGRAVGTLRDLDTLDRKARDYDDEFMKIIGGLAVRQHQTTLDAGRDVIILSAAANDRRWRRITDGRPCAFCAMLATRTDYTSPFAAQYVVGRGKTTKPGARGRRGLGVRPRGSRSLGEKYHDNCGCTVAEVFDDWEPSYAERQQKALYKEARKACKKKGLEPTTKNILAQMRELGDGTVHDAHVPEGEKKKPGRKPKTQTGGSGGGRKKPPRPLMGHNGDGEPRKPKRGGREPRERTAEDYGYWQARQDALPFDTTGAEMKPHEIEFAEAFIADGHEILRWIPQGGVDATGRIPAQSDFEWGPGRLVELKRTGKSGTMKRYIKNNLAKGKRIFMVDFGDIRPATKELRSLQKFAPEGNPDFELWAFWDGHLERLQ